MTPPRTGYNIPCRVATECACVLEGHGTWDDHNPGTLRTQASEKVWNPDLKPVTPQFDTQQENDVDDSGTRTPSASATRSTFTIINPNTPFFFHNALTSPSQDNAGRILKW